MNRRRFLRTTGLAAASAGIAGCTGSGDGTGSEADASVAVVRTAAEDPAPAVDAVAPVTQNESDVLRLEGLIFQRAGEKGVVVAGDLTNESDRAFEDATVEVTLYDANESQDDILDSTTLQTDHGRLDPGNTWRWAATFEDEISFEIEYFAVEASADFVDETEQDG